MRGRSRLVVARVIHASNCSGSNLFNFKHSLLRKFGMKNKKEGRKEF